MAFVREPAHTGTTDVQGRLWSSSASVPRAASFQLLRPVICGILVFEQMCMYIGKWLGLCLLPCPCKDQILHCYGKRYCKVRRKGIFIYPLF